MSRRERDIAAAVRPTSGSGRPERSPGRGVVRFQQAEIRIDIVKDITVSNGHIKYEIKMLNASVWAYRRLGLLGSSTLDVSRRADVAMIIHRIGQTKMFVFGVSGQFAANIFPYCIWNLSV